MLEKLDEELHELAEARETGSQEEREGEVGDLLFVLVNLARFLKVDPEQALRKTNAKFRKRFAYVESRANASGRDASGRWRRCGRRQSRLKPVKPDPSRPKADIRPLTELPNFATPSQLQKEIWGFEDVDVLPLRFFVVASKIGGQAFWARTTATG